MNKIDKIFILIMIIIFLLSYSDASLIFFLVLTLLIYIMYLIYKKRNRNKQVVANINDEEKRSTSLSYNQEAYYEIKNYLTPNEFLFYHKLLNVNDNFIVIPQVPLASIVKKVNGKYQNELNKIIDFGIFDKNFRLLLLIELNDSSHNQINRKDRDLRVKKILDDCFIKLLTFYTKYPNDQEYITKRINETLNIKES